MKDMKDMKDIKNQALGYVVITGKVDSVEALDNGVIFTSLILPAPDEYSFPQLVRISSKRRLANVGDQLTDIVVRLGGYRKKFKFKDKTTGLEKQGSDTVNTLEYIEN